MNEEELEFLRMLSGNKILGVNINHAEGSINIHLDNGMMIDIYSGEFDGEDIYIDYIEE